jgi:hypothetical protein
MPQDFQNPSFEVPGIEAGLALDWTLVIVNSLYEFVVFVRGDTIAIVSNFITTIPAGVTVVDNDDGTLQIINAIGVSEAVESFVYGWDSNQFYLFAFPTALLDEARFSVAKKQEDFEDNFGQDDNFLVGLAATTTVIPLVGRLLTVNEFNGFTVNIFGEERIVASNSTTTITLTVALSNPPAENLTVRVIGGPINDVGFLAELDALGVESFVDTFDAGWSTTGNFKDAFNTNLVLGTLDNNIFTDGAAYTKSLPDFNNFANDLRFLVYSTDTDRQPNNLNITFKRSDGTTIAFFPVTFSVPPGITLDTVNGTEVPLKAAGVALGSTADGIQDLLGMVELGSASGKFTLVGNPHTDLERAHF